MKRSHAMPFGAQVRENGSVRFRLWAPQAQVVELSLDEGTGRHVHLDQLDQGWFELLTSAATSGSRYRFRIDDNFSVPDPGSRFQPCDVRGASQVVDPQEFE